MEDDFVKLSGDDADAIGKEVIKAKSNDIQKFNENAIWDVLRTCYDPEIPVNIVDLGLIYNLESSKESENQYQIIVKMTLTAPGCGMGPAIAQDVENKISNLSFVKDVLVELVWDPQWNQDMMTEEARLQLGMM